MTDFDKKQIPLPPQEEGVQKNTEANTGCDTVEEAKQLFEKVKSRLLDVNNWHSLCGKASAAFMLTDEQGQQTGETPKPGFYFRIDVPGPGTKTGDGFDWVRVEAVEENNDLQADSEFILIRVRPSDNPTTNDRDVAHFFSEKSTSTFLALREKNIVTAAVLGRNEVSNTTGTTSLTDKLRNAVVGISALLGLSTPQWKSLVNGLLGKE